MLTWCVYHSFGSDSLGRLVLIADLGNSTPSTSQCVIQLLLCLVRLLAMLMGVGCINGDDLGRLWTPG